MSLKSSLGRQSTRTGLGACLFLAGVVALFTGVYHDGSGARQLLWIAAVLLVAALLSWVASVRAGQREA